MTTMKKIFDVTGLPTDPDKDEGPATVIIVLGIELDTAVMEVRLPQEILAQCCRCLEKVVNQDDVEEAGITVPNWLAKPPAKLS
jgi:hypothetical protein